MPRLLFCAPGQAPQPERKGTALFAVVPVAILMMALMVAFVGTSVDSSRANTADVDTFRARAAAQNAASIAISDIWGRFEAAANGEEQLWRLRSHLDGRGLTDQASATTPQGTEYLQSLGLAPNLNGRTEIDGVEIERLSVHRVDDWDSTDIVIEVDAVTRRGRDGSSRERRASIQSVFSIAPPEWDGLDYALLANNINCLLCHTNIDNAERFYNSNPLLAGTFDSVKVGTIESIHFRSDPDSKVAGALLIGADALLGDGHDITDWSQFNLSGAAPSAGGTIEKIQEDQFGNPLYGGLNLFDAASPDAGANMYLDFYANADLTDYELPSSFPAPFSDNGGLDPATGQPMANLAGNRVVDDSEFHATVQGSAGVAQGGNITVVPHGGQIDKENEWAQMKKGQDPSVSGVVTGHVYMHGTKNDPILLDGSVAIDGDVIISGYVKGSGTIKARGNVYITGDVLYADGGTGGHRTYGTASDGTKNNLAVAAGGNIVMGDFYHRAWETGNPATGDSNGSFNFTMDEIAIFNRMEWMKTQPTLPGEIEYIQTGEKTVTYQEKVKETYMKTVPVYKWLPTGEKYKKWFYKTVTTSNGLPEPYTQYTSTKVKDYYKWRDVKVKTQTGTKEVQRTRWVKTGRKLTRQDPIMEWVTPQHDNPQYVQGHTARYYQFATGNEIPIFNKKGYYDPASEHWVSDERAGTDDGSWDTSKLTMLDPADTDEPLLYNADGSAKAVISTISPTDGWVSDEMMEKIMHHSMNGNPGGDRTFEVNATLYSANSIVGIAPGRDSQFTNGKMTVNGGLVAADIGLLAPNGTQLNYDGRGARSLSIAADNGLTVTRRLTAPRVRH